MGRSSQNLYLLSQVYKSQENKFQSPFLIIKGTMTRREGTCNVVVNEMQPFNALDKTLQSKDYLQLKDELGLDHYEGRIWQGWHHHVTLTMHAFGYGSCQWYVVKSSGCASTVDGNLSLLWHVIRWRMDSS